MNYQYYLFSTYKILLIHKTVNIIIEKYVASWCMS